MSKIKDLPKHKRPREKLSEKGEAKLRYKIMKNNKQIAKQNTFTEFMLYTTPNGKVKVEIFLRDENLWLTQKRMADLFGVGIPDVNKHLKNIFESNELQESSVISILETTAEDGKKYPTKFYNLDAIEV